MDTATFFKNLQNPELYGSHVKSVEVMQTHISFVALTGEYAYKVKKSVNFGFLDFSTLEKRKYFCEEELRLNKRLCPDVYLEVLPITASNSTLVLNGQGKIIDYVLKMRQFPQERIMTNLLQKNLITDEIIDKICTRLVDFYKNDKATSEVKKYGELLSVKQNVDENFEQTKSVIDISIPKESFLFLKQANTLFFEKQKKVFDQRIKDGCIHDCHGDLHSGNIVVDNAIYIFDCIEFNKRFRFIDVASDIGFLAMDLDYQNEPYLSSYLITKYVETSGDRGIYDVLNFYKSYRAYVRGKVIGFQFNDPHIEQAKKQTMIATAQKYFALSNYYAQLFSLDLRKHKPLLFLVCGLTGTGKSTVAQKIAVDYHASYINTDIVRKELAGIDSFERHHDEFNMGLYDPKNIDRTYEAVMRKASEHLVKGKNVVLDATFQKKNYRDMVYKTARNAKALVIVIQCICPDAVVKKRLDERVKKQSISDGRWEIYQQQKKTIEPFDAKESHLELDTSQVSYEYRMNFFNQLVHQISEAVQ